MSENLSLFRMRECAPSALRERYPNNPDINVLLICDYNFNSANTILDHIFGLQKYSRHNIMALSCLGNIPDEVDLESFDVVIIHYSLIVANRAYINQALRRRIRQFKGLKIVFIQDEYRWIDKTIEAFQYMRISAIFSLLPQDIIRQVYLPEKLPGVRLITLLAGYVPENLIELDVPHFGERRIDVAYRGRLLPAWLGSFAQEKWIIGERFEKDAIQYNLITDISSRECDRVYGEAWIHFLCQTKAVLGTESGASVCDFSGEIQRRVEAHIAQDPSVSFELLKERYFKEYDGRIEIRVISPRCFEAAALRTLMVLYEGRYSGILKPWRHYVPLARDHSNMTEIIQLLRDTGRARSIIDAAYFEIACNPAFSFKSMVKQVDDVIDELFDPRIHAAFDPDAGSLRAGIKELERRQRIFRRRYKLIRLITIFGESIISFLPASWRTPVRSFFLSISHFVSNWTYLLTAFRYNIIRRSAAAVDTLLSRLPIRLRNTVSAPLRRTWYALRGRRLLSAINIAEEEPGSTNEGPDAQGN